MLRINRRRTLQAGAALAAYSALPAYAAQGDTAFITLGDWGWGRSGQRDVAAAMASWAKTNDAKFIMTVGDNFYQKGVKNIADPYWVDRYESVYNDPALIDLPWYPAMGNHDYKGNLQAQLDYVSPYKNRWRAGDGWLTPEEAKDPSSKKAKHPYYKPKLPITTGPSLDIFVIDTTPVVEGRRDEATLLPSQARSQDVAAQRAWLAAALAGSKADWKLIFGHHCVYSGGGHGSYSEMEAWLDPLLQNGAAQAYICGHDHDVQHIERNGVHYIVSGAGGDSRGTFGTRGTVFSRGYTDEDGDFYGFTGHRVDRDRMEVDYVDSRGTVLKTVTVPRVRSA